jgi:uncharacterized protein YkwD
LGIWCGLLWSVLSSHTPSAGIRCGPAYEAGVRCGEVPSGARTNAARDRDTRPIPSSGRRGEDRFVLTSSRRLVPVLLAGSLLAATVGPAMASDPVVTDPVVSDPVVTDAVLAQAERDLVTLTNSKRTANGLIILRTDPDLMSIARDRAQVMAANDVMSHTEPDGQKVFDRISEAGLTWYGAGEIIAWNNYPTEYSAPEAIQAWMESPSHREIMLSTGYNYVGYGAAISASGKRYYAGVFIKEPDETGAWTRFRTTRKTSLSYGRVRVTIRWRGADIRLQVLTAGLRYYEIQRRVVGGTWVSWGTTTATYKIVTWRRPYDREVRVRARDRAGNWGPWRYLRINL